MKTLASAHIQLIIASSILLITLVVMLFPRFLLWVNNPITKIKINSTFEHLSRQEINNLLNETEKMFFFDKNFTSIKNKFLDIPWVNQVFIRRIWPNTLTVDVKERKAIARWGDNYLLDDNGSTFKPKPSTLIDSPQLTGPEGSEKEMWRQFISIKNILKTYPFKITYFYKKSSTTWLLGLDKTIIKLGCTNIISEIKIFMNLYEKKLKHNWKNIAIVDLCYTNGASIKWRIQK